jgi:hypothetical protein
MKIKIIDKYFRDGQECTIRCSGEVFEPKYKDREWNLELPKRKGQGYYWFVC